MCVHVSNYIESSIDEQSLQNWKFYFISVDIWQSFLYNMFLYNPPTWPNICINILCTLLPVFNVWLPMETNVEWRGLVAEYVKKVHTFPCNMVLIRCLCLWVCLLGLCSPNFTDVCETVDCHFHFANEPISLASWEIFPICHALTRTDLATNIKIIRNL